MVRIRFPPAASQWQTRPSGVSPNEPALGTGERAVIDSGARYLSKGSGLVRTGDRGDPIWVFPFMSANQVFFIYMDRLGHWLGRRRHATRAGAEATAHEAGAS
jgi:hypothetical protein